jgi:hypothetical protein
VAHDNHARSVEQQPNRQPTIGRVDKR